MVKTTKTTKTEKNFNRNNGLFVVIATVILSGTMLYISTEIIKSNKDNQQTSQGITNTLSVVGEGKSYVTPDTLVIQASVSELADTTKEAQDSANEKIEQIHKILQNVGIDKKNVKTDRLNINPEYDWREDGRKLLGYRSQQTLTIEIEGDTQIEQGNTIIDAIAAIGSVNINNTRFELKDKNAGYLEARENAFADAKEKAEQLAKLGGVSLGKPVMINDSSISYNNISPMYYAKAEMASMDMAGGIEEQLPTPTLSPGETEVSINISIVYEIY